jgi:MFS family permease
LSGVLLLFGMLAVSWLDALIGRRQAILLSYTLTAAGMAMLWLLRSYPSVWLLYGFLVCFGGTIGSRGPLITATAMTIFRGKSIGTIFGTISVGSGMGSALGSWGGGLIHDLSGGYNLVIGFALASIMVGMIALLVVPALRT